jgi:putative Holliday junction resolvase
VVGFDFGRRRIGIAAGDTLTGTAHPHATVSCPREGPDWEVIGAHLRQLAPKVLVVGLPHHADGTPSELAGEARAFAQALGRRFGLPVDLVDEHGSSRLASEGLVAQRKSGQRRRRVTAEDIDSRAAAVILERWLAGERAAAPMP